MTKETATVDTAKAAVDVINPSNTGETFSLTTGADSGTAFTGTANADTFNASVLTANDGDILDGGLGNDTLNLETASNITENFKTTSIETVNLTALGAITVDAKNLSGMTTLNNNDSTGTATINNLAATTVIGVKGSAVNNIDLNYATGALNGTADKLTVNLNGSSATTVTADAGFESVEVKTTAASTLTTLTASGATALTLSGNATLETAAASIDSFTDYTVTNTAKVTYNDIATVKTFNAATNTGGIVGKDLNVTAGLDNGTTADVLTMSSTGSLIQTGSGNDNINVNTSALLSTNNAIIKLGAGNDTLYLTAGNSGEYVYAEDGDDTIYVATALASNDLIDGGAGIDTVNFAATTHSLIAKGIEKVGVNGATTVNFVSIDSAIAITDTGAGAVTFTNLLNGTTYTSNLAKTGNLSLGFKASEAATLNVNLTKGSDGSVALSNVKDATLTLGAASAFDGIALDKAATNLTMNVTGALTIGTGGHISESSSTITNEKLQTVTITGNKEVTLGDITNDASLTSVSVKSTGGAVTVGTIGAAGNTAADVTVTKIEAISTSGKAVIGNIDFSGVASTATGSINEITASGAGGTAAETTIGTIIADKLGTVTAASSNHNATIGAITVGEDTADTTDGTITALKASGFLAATIGNILADSVGSIVVESTDAITGGKAELGTIKDAKGGAKATIGTIDVTSKKGAAEAKAITADALGNTNITGGTTATAGAITVTNTAKDSVMGNLTVTAGSDKALLGAISADVAGIITAKSTSNIVEVGAMSFLDTTGVSISLTAGTSIGNTTAGTDTIKNEKGDLSLTAKAETTFIAANKLVISAGKSGEVSSDIDVTVDLSAVKGIVGHSDATNVVIVNEGNDSSSSTIVKGGTAANNLTITGATDTSTQTITYNGQNDVDTIVLSGKYASSTIYTELGNDVIALGEGKDSIIAKGNVSVTLNAATIDVDKLDTLTGYAVNDGDTVIKAGGTAAAWTTGITGWTISSGVLTKTNATVADFYSAVVGATGTAGHVAAFVNGGNTYIFGEGADTGDADNTAIVLLGVELTSVSATHGAAVVHIA